MKQRKHTEYKGWIIRRRGTGWQVDFGTKNGKRIQRSYKTKADAKLAVDQAADQAALEEIDQKNRRVALYDLTDEHRMDVLTAFDKLAGHASLTEAAEFYMLHTCPAGGSRTTSEVLGEYLEAKERANRRKTTLDDIKMRIGRLAAQYGDAPIHSITTHDLEKWLNEKGYTQISRLNYRTAFVGFFNYAKKRKYVRENPALNIERPSVDEKIPAILTTKDAATLMRAVEIESPKMIPYFALCLFAGIRPAEVKGLDWRNIDVAKRRITIRPEVAKKRRQRYVDISDNLAEWLAPHRRDSGSIHFDRKSFDSARKRSGVPWPNNVLRHSFGSYHLATHEDAARTAIQMGHMQVGVLFNHYRELVTREDAAEFWAIRPRSECGVVRFAG